MKIFCQELAGYQVVRYKQTCDILYFLICVMNRIL